MAQSYSAFDAARRIGQGPLLDVALAVKNYQENNPQSLPIIFDDQTSQTIDVLLEGDEAEIAAWIDAHFPQPARRGRGRPKLGVIGREVSLLPRQWEWLSAQPGGASVTLRKLIDQAARDPQAERRAAQDSAYRFANAIAGNEPGFEEAIRALYAGDQVSYEANTALWPEDVRAHARSLATRVWQP